MSIRKLNNKEIINVAGGVGTTELAGNWLGTFAGSVISAVIVAHKCSCAYSGGLSSPRKKVHISHEDIRSKFGLIKIAEYTLLMLGVSFATRILGSIAGETIDNFVSK